MVASAAIVGRSMVDVLADPIKRMQRFAAKPASQPTNSLSRIARRPAR